MPNWKKLIVSGSDASLNSLNVTNNVTAQSFTGSFSGSFTAPGATTQVVYNNGGVLAASSNFVFSGSNVGIGTTTPGAIVDIASNGGRLRLTQNAAGSIFNGIDFVSYNGSAYGGFIGNQDTGEIRLNAISTYFPTFYSSGAEVMRISTSGNVGIGTTSPAFKLDVNSGTTASAFRVLSTNTSSLRTFLEATSGNVEQHFLYTGNQDWVLGLDKADSNKFKLASADDGFASAKLTVTTGGNLGIGITSPSTKLDVSGSIRSEIGSDGNFIIFQATGQRVHFIKRAAQILQFTSDAANTYDVRFDSSNASVYILTGSVGIGTTSPTAKLEVNGNVKATSFTGSFSGSITHAVSASYALTSSYASFAQTAGAASTATSASYALSSSYALSASYAVTASHALTASYVNPLNQNLILTGSLIATGDVTASNALINGNLTVIGTASFTYSTSSIVNVGAATITLNTDNPAVRFGGVNVVDSGSFGTSSTGSLLWDSQKNRWIYSNPSGSTYDGGLLISGPRNTTGLGNEEGTTLNALMKGQGGDHITSSGVFEVSGSVGIGTSSPAYTLVVKQPSNSTSTGLQIAQSDSASDGMVLQFISSEARIKNRTTGALTLGTNDTERFRITAGGDVGIGTTSPVSKLETYDGDISVTTANSFSYLNNNRNFIPNSSGVSLGALRYRGYSTGTTYQVGTGIWSFSSLGWNSTSTPAYLSFQTTPSGSVTPTEKMVITSEGLVGIGLTSPNSTLHLYGGGDQYLTIQSSTTGASTSAFTKYIRSTTGSARTWWTGVGIQGGSDDSYSFYDQTAAAERMRITSAGNVGIGTTTPTTTLEVNGNVKATSFTGSFSGSVTAPGSTTQIVYNDNGVLAANSGLVYSGSNVGIGISAPTEKLHIVGTASGNQFARITATDSDSSAAWVAQNDSSDNVVYRVFSSGVSGTQMGSALGRSASLLANLGGSGVFLLGTFSNTNFILGTNNTERMRITNGGNVGIGTSSPLTRLDLRASSNSAITPLASVPDTATTLLIGNTGTNGVLALGHDNAGHPWLQGRSVLANQAAEDILINPLGGNVGIGTTNPTYKLHVSSSNNNDGIAIHYPANNSTVFPFYVGDSNNGIYARLNASEFEFKRNGAASTIKTVGSSNNLTLESATNLIFNTDGASERMRIDTSGNVGIGTSSPQTGFKLDVNGSTVTRGEIYSNSDIIGFGANENYKIAESGNTWLAKTTGAVGIGTTSPTSKLDVRGTLTVSGSGANVDIKSSTTTSTLNIYGLDTSTNFLGVGILSDNVTRWRAGMVSGRKYQIAYADGGGSFTPTAAMTIVSGSGNVGIGTASPAEKLHVSGDSVGITIDGTTASRTYYNRAGSYIWSTGLRAGDTKFHIYDERSADRFVIDDSGNVGIGTTSPNSQLTLSKATGNTMLQLVNADETGFSLKTYNSGSGTLQGRVFMQYLDYSSTVNGYMAYHRGGGGSDGFLSFGDNGGERVRFANGGNVGIGTTSPSQRLSVMGAVSASTYYGDGSNLTGIGSGSVAAAGSDGQLQYNNSGLFGGASRLYYNDSTNRVGIGTSSPGYDLDVSGSVRAQDRLRVGPVNSGNGVIHQSSDATINPTSATVVWTVSGTAGICAFIEYYLLNSNTGTSQRAGNIVTTWNAAGTPQITHTETSTPDVGSTTPVTFSTSLTLGGDPQLIATNSGGDTWYMIMNYRYF